MSPPAFILVEEVMKTCSWNVLTASFLFFLDPKPMPSSKGCQNTVTARPDAPGNC